VHCRTEMKMKFCLTFTICFLSLLGIAFGRGNYAVLIQESPAGAGEIQPGIGVHDFAADEIVTLTTVPKTGWKFLFWLGDVHDPTQNRTMTAVDGPKIIIAVFGRDEFEMLDPAEAVSIGPGRLTPRHDTIGGGLGGGISPSSQPDYSPYYPPENPPDDPPPVPEVPEPATAMILGIGALLVISRKKYRMTC